MTFKMIIQLLLLGLCISFGLPDELKGALYKGRGMEPSFGLPLGQEEGMTFNKYVATVKDELQSQLISFVKCASIEQPSDVRTDPSINSPDQPEKFNFNYFTNTVDVKIARRLQNLEFRKNSIITDLISLSIRDRIPKDEMETAINDITSIIGSAKNSLNCCRSINLAKINKDDDSIDDFSKEKLLNEMVETYVNYKYKVFGKGLTNNEFTEEQCFDQLPKLIEIWTAKLPDERTSITFFSLYSSIVQWTCLHEFDRINNIDTSMRRKNYFLEGVQTAIRMLKDSVTRLPLLEDPMNLWGKIAEYSADVHELLAYLASRPDENNDLVDNMTEAQKIMEEIIDTIREETMKQITDTEQQETIEEIIDSEKQEKMEEIIDSEKQEKMDEIIDGEERETMEEIIDSEEQIPAEMKIDENSFPGVLQLGKSFGLPLGQQHDITFNTYVATVKSELEANLPSFVTFPSNEIILQASPSSEEARRFYLTYNYIGLSVDYKIRRRLRNLSALKNDITTDLINLSIRDRIPKDDMESAEKDINSLIGRAMNSLNCCRSRNLAYLTHAIESIDNDSSIEQHLNTMVETYVNYKYKVFGVGLIDDKFTEEQCFHQLPNVIKTWAAKLPNYEREHLTFWSLYSGIVQWTCCIEFDRINSIDTSHTSVQSRNNHRLRDVETTIRILDESVMRLNSIKNPMNLYGKIAEYADEAREILAYLSSCPDDTSDLVNEVMKDKKIMEEIIESKRQERIKETIDSNQPEKMEEVIDT